MVTRVRPNRLERLTNLVLALLSTDRPLSLREIGATVAGYPTEERSLRQAFERDKRVLRDNGIPVTLERPMTTDDQVGYRIKPEHYYLPDLGLTPAEQLALGFAIAAVRLEGGAGRDALTKLGSPDVPDLPPMAVLPSAPALGPLQEAVRARAAVSFKYNGRQRVVEPYGLCFRSGTWYVVGNDRSVGDGGELRTFRVDRIGDSHDGRVEAGEPGSFEPPTGLDLREMVRYVPWRSHAETSIEAVVDFEHYEARSGLAAGGRRCEEGRDSPAVRMAFSVGDEEGFVNWVVGLGDAAVVVSPGELRERVVSRLQAIAQREADDDL
jgi:predicted DNA-binding transcriptional regulator YafY